MVQRAIVQRVQQRLLGGSAFPRLPKFNTLRTIWSLAFSPPLFEPSPVHEIEGQEGRRGGCLMIHRFPLPWSATPSKVKKDPDRYRHTDSS